MHWLPNICNTFDRRGSTRLPGHDQRGLFIDSLCERNDVCGVASSSQRQACGHSRLAACTRTRWSNCCTLKHLWWQSTHECCQKAVRPRCSTVHTASFTVAWQSSAGTSTLTATGQSPVYWARALMRAHIFRIFLSRYRPISWTTVIGVAFL